MHGRRGGDHGLLTLRLQYEWNKDATAEAISTDTTVVSTLRPLKDAIIALSKDLWPHLDTTVLVSRTLASVIVVSDTILADRHAHSLECPLDRLERSHHRVS